MRGGVFLAFMLVAVVVLTGHALASDPAFVAAVNGHIKAVRAAQRATAASQGDPDTVQRQYDLSRDFVEALRAAGGTSTACQPAAQAAQALAQAEVRQTEGYDLPDLGVVTAATRKIEASAATYNAAAAGCVQAGTVANRPAPTLESPLPSQAFIGPVIIVGKAPAQAQWVVATGGRPAPSCAPTGARLPVRQRHVRGTIALTAGRQNVNILFCAGTPAAPRTIQSIKVPGVWVLPSTANKAASPTRTNASLEQSFASTARSFSGISAIWYHDLVSGATAGWNTTAQFPAASTVKLGLLVAAIDRFGTHSRVAYDIAAMATWSSNLATNRLLVKVGGSEAAGSAAAQAALTRMGAARSTFTGGYRVGTARRHSETEPPRISSRVTTARDLGTMLFVIHSGALGNRAALQKLGLTQREASLALGLLLSSKPERDNIGLFRPALGATPAAQKQGWFSVVRHTAAVIYTPTGPRILVLLTYATNNSLASAQRYGAGLIRLLRL